MTKTSSSDPVGPTVDDIPDIISTKLSDPDESQWPAEGEVKLYSGETWTASGNNIRTLNIKNYRPNVRHFIGDSFNNQARLVLFNLPKNTVMTLSENFTSLKPDENIASLRGQNRTIELIGKGKAVWFDLKDVDMSGLVSGFYYRKVSMDFGAIELFTGTQFQSKRLVLFLCEWTPGTIFNLVDSPFHSIESVRWKAMTDVQSVTLYNKKEGNENNYANIDGGTKKDRIDNLRSETSFGSEIGGFSWKQTEPLYQVVEPFTLQIPSNSSRKKVFTTIATGTNKSPEKQSVKVSLRAGFRNNITVVTTDTHLVDISAKYEAKWGFSYMGFEASSGYTLSMQYQYTYDKDETTEKTDDIMVEITEDVNIPANSTYDCRLSIEYLMFPETHFTTKATRWYKEPLPKTEFDQANQLYKREEIITGVVSGGFHANQSMKMESTPIP